MEYPLSCVVATCDDCARGLRSDPRLPWLCRYLTAMHTSVAVAAVTPCTAGHVARALSALLGMARIVVVAGGASPQAHLSVLRGVCSATGRELVFSDEAYEHVRAAYARLCSEGAVRPSEVPGDLEELAMIPEGAEPLPNPRGVLPAVVFDHEGTAVACIPGEPAELASAFRERVEAELRPYTPARYAVEITVARTPWEADAAREALVELQRDRPWLVVLGGVYALPGEPEAPVVAKVFAETPEDLSERVEEVEAFARDRVKRER